MIWDWEFVWAEALPPLLKVVHITVLATLYGFAIAALLGLLLALLRRAPVRVVSWPVVGFIEYVRSTPLLIQIYIVYFGLLPALNLDPTPFFAGVLALGIHFSTYTSEVYRAGIESVPRGQWEAATALNFRLTQKMVRVILPQAIPPVIPALGNYLVAMFKETPLLAAIGVLELLLTAKNTGSYTFRYIEPFTIVGVFFLIMSIVASLGVLRLEDWLKRRRPG